MYTSDRVPLSAQDPFSLFVRMNLAQLVFFFFFNDTATTEIYTLSLHDALPISQPGAWRDMSFPDCGATFFLSRGGRAISRSEEHPSELQSQSNLVCRLLLEKKKTSIHSFLPTSCL